MSDRPDDKPRRDMTVAHEGRRRAARLRRFEKMIEELRQHGYQVTPPADTKS